MKLESVSIKNFRCYRDEIHVPIANLTTFVGRNDIGKSTVLEALEIFFNNETVKIEPGDANVYSDDKRVSITCEFSELPDSLTLDAGAPTTLTDEYLATEAGTLKIQKVYDCKGKTVGAPEIFVLARHPTAKGVSELLELKEKDLQTLVRAQNLDVQLKGNPGMRKALWAATPDLVLADVSIAFGKAKEDAKRIWEQLDSYLPMYALFQSDRDSKDSDGEVQTPMKAAVAAAIAEVQDQIDVIQAKVRERAEEIARSTHEALKTIDPGLARELTPQFTPPTTAKWTGLFSVGMETDDGIPLNKRGSGVRRLVLVSFFKAAAKRKLTTTSKRSVIYAIEEPETGQHPNNQRILIDSFKAISEEDGCQVVLTTHSPGLAADLPVEGIRFITRDAAGSPLIQSGVDVFGVVAATLGVIADSRVKVLLCVEGPTDVDALKCLSKALHVSEPGIPDLSTSSSVAFVVLGGSTLQHWVSQHYLQGLGRPEVHIYDSDVAKYAQVVEQVNQRGDRSWGVQTVKYEIENYLHSDAILQGFNVQVVIPDQRDAQGRDVSEIFSAALYAAQGQPVGSPINSGTAKKRLARTAFPLMTAAMIDERDPQAEVRGWFRRLAALV